MFSKTRTENKHEAQGRKIRLFLSSVLTFGNREGLGKFFWATKHLKTSLFAKSKSDQRLPTRGLLRVWHLFLSSLSPSWLPSLPPTTSRCPLFNVKEMDAPESLPNSEKVMEVSQGCAGAAAQRLNYSTTRGTPGLPPPGFCSRSLTLARTRIRLRSARCWGAAE